MKRILTTATLGALAIVTLTAAAQQAPRFRYLGKAGTHVVLATDATGPQNARRLQSIVAAATPTLPGASDNVEFGMSIDCTNRTVAVSGVVTYLGTVERLRTDATTAPSPIKPGSSNELIYNMACGGKIAQPPVWLDGPVNARAWALAQAKK